MKACVKRISRTLTALLSPAHPRCSHLLGKKSWNVYNADNIERVRRDEAAAAAREAERERRMQEDDAARRLAILRGEEPPPPPLPEPGPDADGDNAAARPLHREWGPPFEGRKRKRRGEDDTDFEMRVARERAEVGDRAAREMGRGAGGARAGRGGKEVSLVDARGHIDLFGAARADDEEAARRGGNETRRDGRPPRREEKPATAAATSAAAEGCGMRFADAGGRRAGLADGRKPWYAAREEAEPQGAAAAGEMQVKPEDAFGRQDPGRKAREVARLSAGDPLAAMRSGARKVRELERDRRNEREERERELRDLRREERRREKRRRHEGRKRSGADGGDDLESLEGFSLDAPPPSKQSDKKYRDERHRDRHRDEDRHHRERDRSSRDDEKDYRRPRSDRERSDGHRSHHRHRHHEHSR